MYVMFFIVYLWISNESTKTVYQRPGFDINTRFSKFGGKALQVIQASRRNSLGRGGGTLVFRWYFNSLVCHYSATASKKNDIKLTLIDHLTCIYNTWRFPCEPITSLVCKWCIYISKVVRTADGELCG